MKLEPEYQDKPAYQALCRFFDAYVTRRNIEDTLSCVTEDVYSLGTGEHEFARNKEEFCALLVEEIESAPDPIDMKLSDYRERMLAPGVYDCQCKAESKIWISDVEFIIFSTRLTACFRTEEDGVLRACGFHMSAPNREQDEGEYLPLHYGTRAGQSISEESKIKLQVLLNESIPGGIMGGYVEENFPLYIINDYMIKMLGYDSYDEFREYTKEEMLRTIYKADREKVSEVVNSALEPGDKYEVEYRIIRKDGSVLWCHDVGQVIRTENGRKAVISVIVDISERMAYQELMDQLRESGNRDSILYYTVNVTTGEMLHGREMFNCVEDGYDHILRNFVCQCVHPNERERLLEMVEKPDFYEKQLKEQPRFELRMRVDIQEMTKMVRLSESARRHLELLESQWAWTLFQGVLIKDQRGDIWMQVELRDISIEMKERDEMHRNAESHLLTGLLNRRAWDRKVRRRLQQGCMGTLIMIDIDYFKEVNDNLGHLEGDLVLKETAQILNHTFRGDDLIGHIGGDEFCVFAYSLTDFESIQTRMDQLLEERRRFYRGKDGKTRKLSFSIGIAFVEPEVNHNLENLVSRADRALYQAKEAGRDCWRLYMPERN